MNFKDILLLLSDSGQGAVVTSVISGRCGSSNFIKAEEFHD